jgi:hypothetical protein
VSAFVHNSGTEEQNLVAEEEEGWAFMLFMAGNANKQPPAAAAEKTLPAGCGF